MTEARRTELGDFLRSRRERLDPEAAGLPTVRRRRTPGLRREEVAFLAGIGIDWYVRLEQGRTVNPSAATINAVARALRLDRAEHAHLKALAGGGQHRAFEREVVPEAVRRIVEGLDRPAYVTGLRWDVLVWNQAADEVFAFSRLADCDRNILISMFTRAGTRSLFGPAWPDEARRMLAQFRPTYDLWAADPAFGELIGRLRTGSSEFAGWWDAHDVREATAGQKIMNHPTRGALRFEYATFQANDDPALKLAIYAPAPMT